MKNCLMCAHFFFTTAMIAYGPMTPGSDIEIGCGRNHWELDNEWDSEEKFRQYMLSANTCKDYEEREAT